jgi:hypothetical protein
MDLYAGLAGEETAAVVLGGVEWIEEGPGNAAYPEWTPSGGIVYMAGHDRETAYEAWSGNSKNGATP